MALYSRRLDICHAGLTLCGSPRGLSLVDRKGRAPTDFLPRVLATDTLLFTWGRSDDWQLGYVKDVQKTPREVRLLPSSDLSVTSIRVAKTHCLALANDGTMWSFGQGGRGKLGLAEEGNAILPQTISVPVKFIAISASDFHCLAVSDSRSLFAWGDNSKGQLGSDDLPHSAVPLPVHKRMHWLHVSTGKWTSAGVTTRGEVAVWGDNSKGQHFQSVAQQPTIAQLGPLTKPTEKSVLVSAGESHSAILSSENNVYLSVPGRILTIHVQKQFALRSLQSVVLLNDGVYCLGDNGDLFYLPFSRISQKKEHYVMDVIAHALQWISEGSLAMVGVGERGEFYEIREGTCARQLQIAECRSGGTNSNVFSAIVPCHRPSLPPTPSGVLSLSDICQYGLLPSTNFDSVCQLWMFAEVYSCEVLREYAERFLAANAKVMASQAYADYFFALPVEAMEGVQRRIEPFPGEIWVEDQEPAVETEKKPIAPKRIQPEKHETPPPLQCASELSSESQQTPVALAGDFPALGASPPLHKPRAYSDTTSIDLRDFVSSPFTVKVSKKRRKKSLIPPAKPPAWGESAAVQAQPLCEVQEEQKAGGKFFNSWGVDAEKEAQNFAEIQEMEKDEEEMQLALQIIAEMNAEETRNKKRKGSRKARA